MANPLATVIVTKLLKPTRTLGARVRSISANLQTTTDYDAGKGAYGNFFHAAREHAAKVAEGMKLLGDGRLPIGAGHVWIFDFPEE